MGWEVQSKSKFKKKLKWYYFNKKELKKKRINELMVGFGRVKFRL